MRDFAIGIEWTGDTVHLRVRGELDIGVADRLVDRVAAVRDAAVRRVLVDLHDVTFMDSSGLRALLSAQGMAADDFDVIAIRPPACVRDVLGITGAGPLLRVAPDAHSALAGLA